MNYTSETLYHKAKTGKIQTWRTWTKGGTIFTEHGQMDGKKQVSEKEAEPKNVGKSNETTAAEQAVIEAKALFTYKLKRKYSLSVKATATDENYLPMLACKFVDRVGKFNYPVDSQPKLDGVRCVALKKNGAIRLMSRSGIPWKVPHIAEQLNKVMKEGEFRDGEIYVHGLTLQRITSLVKDYREESSVLEYHMYDMPSDKSWPQRRQSLESSKLGTHLFVVESITCYNAEEVETNYLNHLDDDYEGSILRVHDKLDYRFGYKSSYMMKYKPHEDDEFKIVGHTNGKGKAKDWVIWICQSNVNPEDTFTVVPKGTAADRAAWLKEADKHVGSMLKVRYANLTPDGKPFHPRGLAIRLPEDM